MLILGLDSAAGSVGAALLDDGRPLASARENGGVPHAVGRLLPLVERVLASGARDRTELAAVAVTVGPGSYTGLRAAVATAKGLCFALGLPAVPVGTLAALAFAAGPRREPVAPCLDARRGRVYGAVYRWWGGLLQESAAPAVAPATAWLAGLPSPVYLTGTGLEGLEAALPAGAMPAPPALRSVDPVAVAALGAAVVAAGGGVPAERLLPVYVSDPVITPPRQAKADG